MWRKNPPPVAQARLASAAAPEDDAGRDPGERGSRPVAAAGQRIQRPARRPSSAWCRRRGRTGSRRRGSSAESLIDLQTEPHPAQRQRKRQHVDPHQRRPHFHREAGEQDTSPAIAAENAARAAMSAPDRISDTADDHANQHDHRHGRQQRHDPPGRQPVDPGRREQPADQVDRAACSGRRSPGSGRYRRTPRRPATGASGTRRCPRHNRARRGKRSRAPRSGRR